MELVAVVKGMIAVTSEGSKAKKSLLRSLEVLEGVTDIAERTLLGDEAHSSAYADGAAPSSVADKEFCAVTSNAFGSTTEGLASSDTNEAIHHEVALVTAAKLDSEVATTASTCYSVPAPKTQTIVANPVGVDAIAALRSTPVPSAAAPRAPSAAAAYASMPPSQRYAALKSEDFEVRKPSSDSAKLAHLIY